MPPTHCDTPLLHPCHEALTPALTPPNVTNVIAHDKKPRKHAVQSPFPSKLSDILTTDPVTLAPPSTPAVTNSHPRRARLAAFTHSLERNGANNFLLSLIRDLCQDVSITILSPREGALRSDYESLGVRVSLHDTASPSHPFAIETLLQASDLALANTILNAHVVLTASHLNVPCFWVIHEAWPRDQLDHYARDVFLMPHVDTRAITAAFACSRNIVFPARVQRACYVGLYDESAARVVYNGIPRERIDTFRKEHCREDVRAAMGVGKDDVLLVQIGTVCRRKAQLVTCEAFGQLAGTRVAGDANAKGKRLRLVMVGARYIRQHEVHYIAACKAALHTAGADHRAEIHDVQTDVRPYYHAADIVLCPSENEVLPLVIGEAMLFERAVIATSIDGIPEAIDDGVEGMLIEPGYVDALRDAVMVLAADAGVRRRMGEAGRRRAVRQFGFPKMAQAYRNAIGGVLGADL